MTIWLTMNREERTAAVRDGAAAGLDAIKLARTLKTAPAAIESHAQKFGIGFADDSKASERPQPPARNDRRQRPSTGNEPTDGGDHVDPPASTSQVPAPRAPTAAPAQHGRFTGTGWTDERKTALPGLVGQGLSGSQIAALLGGGLSRNAVISRIHRKGIAAPARPRATSAAARKHRATVDAPKRPKVYGNPQKRVESAQRRLQAFAKPAPEPKPMPVDVPEPVSLGLTLLQLETSNCKWPTGNRMPFLFCGHARFGETPYCQHHALRAGGQPLSNRQKRLEGLAVVFR
jgi:GcrA cell cycle regulator